MHYRYLPLLIVSLLAASAARSVDQHQLSGNSRAATVQISPQPAGRRLISLPDLEFQVRINADCQGNATAESVSISIADTIETHDAAKLNTEKSGELMIETTIQVASGQLAPIPVERFCTSDNDDKMALQELFFPAAFAATISLRCSTDDAQSVSYASLPLDIRLVCNATENQRTDSRPD